MLESLESATKVNDTHPKIVTLDLETEGLDWQKDKILLNGYRLNRKGPVILVDPEKVNEELNSYLANPSVTLSGHNIKFDALFLAQNGYTINCQLECTKVLAYLCWPTEESHGLKHLVRSKLGRQPTELSDLLFKPLKRELIHLERHQDEYFIIGGRWGRKDLITQYHAEDVLNVDRIRSMMAATKWFYDVEKPLTKLLFDVELHGCPLDKAHLNLLQLEYQAICDSLLKTLGEGFNPNSPAQVAKMLTETGHDLSKISKKTESGNYSIDKQVLKKLAWNGSEIAKTLLDYRRVSKLLGTYIGPFLECSTRDGRVHGSFNQTGTDTGRLSSSDPNLQNIPARTKQGKQVRKAFIASEGIPFDSDLKQIEPRLVGHESQSPKLIKAYADGRDTHMMFAEDIFGGQSNVIASGSVDSRDLGKGNVNEQREHPSSASSSGRQPDTGSGGRSTHPAITPTERFIGKTSWLATVYGCSPKKLLLICETFSDDPLTLDIEKFLKDFYGLPKKAKWGNSQEKMELEYGNKAQEIFAKWQFFRNVQDKFIKANPEIWGWRNEHIERTKKLGYIKTLGGRIIRIPGLNSSNKWDVIEAERMCVNYQIQGSAADVMKMILIEFGRQIQAKGNGRILATVHDEIWGQIRDASYLAQVKDVMENTVKLNNVRIEADSKMCANWGEK